MSQHEESETEAMDSQLAVHAPIPQPRLLFQEPQKAKDFHVSWNFDNCRFWRNAREGRTDPCLFQDLQEILFKALTHEYMSVAKRTILLMKKCQPLPMGLSQSCLDFSYPERSDKQMKVSVCLRAQAYESYVCALNMHI